MYVYIRVHEASVKSKTPCIHQSILLAFTPVVRPGREPRRLLRQRRRERLPPRPRRLQPRLRGVVQVRLLEREVVQEDDLIIVFLVCWIDSWCGGGGGGCGAAGKSLPLQPPEARRLVAVTPVSDDEASGHKQKEPQEQQQLEPWHPVRWWSETL